MPLEIPDYHENKYPIHAFHRVLYAKMGSLVDASDAYPAAIDVPRGVWR